MYNFNSFFLAITEVFIIKKLFPTSQDCEIVMGETYCYLFYKWNKIWSFGLISCFPIGCFLLVSTIFDGALVIFMIMLIFYR